jgi:crotonobetainyl-CoA:carnitine CoA-transferase CaiB-like acyl-CoA transferase
MTQPLAGIRVLDLSAVFSGPMATTLLADQGAQVLKIETPEGDTTRRLGPAKGDLSAMFIAANHGKRSIALDLKTEDGRAIVRELARRADVLVENFRPGAMARLGFDYDAVARLNPRIVYLSISGYGQTGPYADGRVYDAVIQAVSGFSAAHRDHSTGEPSLLATAVCDKLTALTASQAIVTALFARERDGKGRRIEVSMLDSALAFQWPDAMYNHVFVDRPEPPYPEFGATQKPWKTRDGFVATMAPQPDEFRALCKGFGHAELADDPRFASPPARARNGKLLRELLEPLAAQQDTAHFVAALRATGTPIGQVNERAQVVTDPQVVHNGALATIDHGELGRVRLARAAARFVGHDQPDPGLGAHLGEHGPEVLRELGYDEARIASLIATRVLRVPAAPAPTKDTP